MKRKFPAIVSFFAISLLSMEVNADPTISLAEWSVKVYNFRTQETKTINIDMVSEPITIPSSNSWKCYVKSADEKHAIRSMVGADGTIFESSRIVCNCGDTWIWNDVICLVRYQGSVMRNQNENASLSIDQNHLGMNISLSCKTY